MIDDSSSLPISLGIEPSYRGISRYNNSNMVLETSALNELRSHLSFAQLRFHCRKQLGRTFHVTTVANSTGEAVVQYFSRQTDTMPYACGSFARLTEDNSITASNCTMWGKDGGVYHVGKLNGDMKECVSCTSSQRLFSFSTIGLLIRNQVGTDGNVTTLDAQYHLETSGIFMFVKH